jgi:hypothetical protein
MRVREENRLIMIILLWFLWTERNLVREQGRRRSADTLARSIRLYAAEISKQQEKESSSSVRSKQQWSRPPEGIVKLNCDASFKADSKTGSWGLANYFLKLMHLCFNKSCHRRYLVQDLKEGW